MERSSFIQLVDSTIVALDQDSKALILESLNEMSTSALRCLGFAYKDDPPEFITYNGDEDHPAHQLLLNPSNYASIESQLIFVGFVGIRVSFPVSNCFFIFLLLLLFSLFPFFLFPIIERIIMVGITYEFSRTLLEKRFVKQLRTAELLEFV